MKNDKHKDGDLFQGEAFTDDEWDVPNGIGYQGKRRDQVEAASRGCSISLVMLIVVLVLWGLKILILG